jgi:cysteinyl-tRNA synthetase
VFRLYDTRTRQVEEIRPAGRGVLRMYSCGPPGSRRAHIGDLRAYLPGDLIRRNGEHRHHLTVLTCQNVSDVADPGGNGGPGPAGGAVLRADGAAADPTAGELFQADCAALNLRPAESAPRSSEWAGLVTGMLDRLAGAGWTPPWGTSPPGRAAECAAVSLHFLGEVIDIHAGGSGPPSPHLEQERALADAAAGHPVVRHWVHGGPVRFDGAAMAGPAGNVLFLDDLADRDLDPLALRLEFLRHRYTEPVSLSWDTLAAADRALRRWRELVAEWAQSPSKPLSAPVAAQIAAAFDDDLDTEAAVAALHRLEQDTQVPPGAKFETFAHADQLLGLDLARDIGRVPARPQTASG